jgi:hypothetical protein
MDIMSRPPPLSRRGFLVASGLAVTGFQGTAAAQETGNQSTDSATTQPSFEPEIDLDCYVARVEAEAYDSVDLIFADGTIEAFTAGYSGTTRFGFGGDGRLEPSAETTIEEFHGPIARVTVTNGTAAETATNSGPCVFGDLAFNCDSASHSQADDVQMTFVDGSSKQWDPPASDQTQFGSPGRAIETISEESADITVENPNPNCSSGEYATVFDCIEVTVGPEEFAAEPTFERIRLDFVDGTSQMFGQRGGESTFTAPETFAGTDDNVGKIIESVVIETQDGDIVFQLVNPTVEACGQETGFEPSVSASQYSVTVDAPSYDRVVCTFGDGTTEPFEGEFSGDNRFGYVGVEELWDAPENRTYETFHGPIERCRVEHGDSQFETVVETTDPAVSGVEFSCSGVEFTGTTADSRLYYADGSFDWFQREQSGAVQFGSPGRLLDGIHLADQGLWLSNPSTDCQPETDSEGITFDCQAVRLTDAEFGPASGAINRVQLMFTDGSDQVFGSRNPEATAFETPAVFSGVDDHAGKVIASVLCELPGRDALFLRTNPTINDCEPVPNPVAVDEGGDGGGSTLDSDGDGSGDPPAIAQSEAEVVSSSLTVLAADTGEPLHASPDAPSEPVEATGGSVAARQPAIETESTMVDGIPWWGWVAGLGGASGVLAKFVTRTVDELAAAEPAAGADGRSVDAASVDDNESGAGDGESGSGGSESGAGDGESGEQGSTDGGESGTGVNEEQYWWEYLDDE